jgi:spermidine synthase
VSGFTAALPYAPVRFPAVRSTGIPNTIAVSTSGAALLCAELAASRVLAPFFGNSLFVWGALIGVFLGGLAIGYWLGGALADRIPAPELLATVMGLGAAALLAAPFLDEHVLEAVVAWDPGPRANPVIASILLFGLPSVLLAGVTPIAVRLRARELEKVGSTAGGLFSISTIGSIVGTFAAAFWLIPDLGTHQLLGVTAAAVFAAATGVAATRRRVLGALVTAAACGGSIVAAIAFAPHTGGTLSPAAARNWSPVYRLRESPSGRPKADYAGSRVLFRKDTEYHQLAVIQSGDGRVLRFGSSFQSAMSVAKPFATQYSYTDMFSLAKLYRPATDSMLFLGLGGGSAPKRMWRDFPELQVDVVELDPVVVDVARRYFAVPDDQRLRIETEDGRLFLAKTDQKWGAIAIDVFYEDGIPFHMATFEFLQLVRERLQPGGVVLMNVIGAIGGDQSELFRALYRTFRAVFPTVVVHPDISPDGGFQNLMVVASEQAAPAKSFLLARWRQTRDRTKTFPDLREAIRNRVDSGISVGGVPTLTDDYAPTDALLLE